MENDTAGAEPIKADKMGPEAGVLPGTGTGQGENGNGSGNVLELPGKAKDPERVRRSKVRVNYALAGALASSGLTWDEMAKQCGAKTGQSLRIGMHRKGITKAKANSLPIGEGRISAVLHRTVTAGAEAIRDKVAGQLGQSVDILDTVPVRYEDLASKGQGRAAVLKTLAETHKLLYGGADQTVIVFGVESMGEAALEPAIDVTSTVSDTSVDSIQAPVSE